MALTSYSIIGLAVGGIAPTLVWLWFWLREDGARPEPRLLLGATFLAGGLATIPAFFAEKLSCDTLFGDVALLCGSSVAGFTGVALIATWSAIEELSKYLAAFLTGERTKRYDEPIDALVYLITAALGFAAAENIFFLVDTLINSGAEGNFILSGNLRFLGANVLHAVSSGFAGAVMAYAFYKPLPVRIAATIGGLVVAIALHSVFNLLIMRGGSDGQSLLATFALFWIVAAALLYVFERVKRITPSAQH